MGFLGVEAYGSRNYQVSTHFAGGEAEAARRRVLGVSVRLRGPSLPDLC